MSSFRRKLIFLASAAVLSSLSLFGQSATNSVSAAPKSPVAMFRELLAMSPADRRMAIAIRPPDIQKRILEKLDEYQILPGELREQRLRETELRWYLRPLMDKPRSDRAAQLALIPEDERKIVVERLQLWDLLPPPLQEEWKNDDMIASYLAQTGPVTGKEREELLQEIPPDRRAELEKGLEHWNEMSEAQRAKALANFNNFFVLTPEEKEKTLDTIPDENRRQMEQTLEAYGNLTAEQRAQCIRSFEKFATMSVAERQQFLQNAERWHDMTPEERQKWRQLVEVAPIMPPRANPLGESGASQANTSTVATN